jgi:hypothetical protein
MNYPHDFLTRDFASAIVNSSCSSEIRKMELSHCGQRNVVPSKNRKFIATSQLGHIGVFLRLQFTPNAYSRLRDRNHNTRKSRHDGNNTSTVSHHTFSSRLMGNIGNSFSVINRLISRAVLPARPAIRDMPAIDSRSGKSFFNALTIVMARLYPSQFSVVQS